MAALNFALSEIVRRHESLRSCLLVQNGEPLQIVTPAQPLKLPLLDLRRNADVEAEARRLTREEALIPFDLTREIPLRAQLLQRKDKVWTLLLTFASQRRRWLSLGILIRELVALYGAFLEGRPLRPCPN